MGLFSKSKKVLVLKTTNGEIINKEDILSPFDLNNLTERKEGGGYYLLNEQNTQIALSLLPELNKLVKDAKKLYASIPLRQFTEKQFAKQKVTTKYEEYYTLQFNFNPLTKAKKELSKYPFMISFYPSDKIFANVSYNKIGTAEKVELIIWSDICYIINAIRKNDILTIKSIYQHNCAEKTKIYSE